ncbi:MAG: hypothetical protein WCJ35_21385 [Planctomycetota bacterium]
MKRRKKTNRPARRPEDAHLAFGPMKDPAAWTASIAIDAADDRRWLAANPTARCRKRLISRLEIQATGNPPDTIVIVYRGEQGSQIRTFHPPEDAIPLMNPKFSRN